MTTNPKFSSVRPPMQVIEPDAGEDEALGAIAQSLTHVASVMDQLTGQLTQLTEAFGQTRSRRHAEAEIGQLFVRAQEHVDRSRSEAEADARQIVSVAHDSAQAILSDADSRATSLLDDARTERDRLLDEARAEADGIVLAARTTAQGIVADARGEAEGIVAEAHREAARIVADAQKQAVLDPQAVARLTSTVDAFANMNTELVVELSALRALFDTPAKAAAAVAIDPSAAPTSITRQLVPGVYEPEPSYPPPPSPAGA